MFQIIDRISSICARLSAWLFFIIGGIIVFEVVARYVFLSPTIWGEEMSRFLQIWATYLAAAYVLQQRKLIAIDVVINKMPPAVQKFLDSCALVVIMVFCAVACIWGSIIVVDSITVGRATSTMLAVPSWMTEIAIPIGFGLMLIQAVVEFCRTLAGSTGDSASLL